MLAVSSSIEKPTGYGRFFYGVMNHSGLSRWIAVIITLIFHLLVLWLAVRGGILLLSDDPAVAQLHYIELPPIEEPASLRVVEPPVINSDAFRIKPVQDTLPLLSALILEPEPLTSQELKELLDTNNYSLPNGTAEIARNVFHPGLRKQLTIEANKPVLARVEDHALETYTDPSGATIVKLGSGNCLRSPAEKIGEPKNWYMTPCAGKNESERIMDRVNEAVNKKTP